MPRKGQAATEFLIILGVALAILVVIVGIGYKSLNQGASQYELNKANIVLSDLSNAAKLVYQQGVGAKTRVYVTMPDEVDSVDLSGESIIIEFNSGTKKFKNLGFNVSGNISTSGGRWVYVEALEGSISLSHNASSQAEEEEGAVCGNNVKEAGEVCDGTDLDDETCVTQGFDSGTLACSVGCGSFDTSSCETEEIGASWTTVFFDDFDRTNSANIGGEWTETGGEWDILNNRAHADDCDSPGDQITTPNIDLSSYSNATLTYAWEYSGLESGECLNFDVNDGSGWQTDVFTYCGSGSSSSSESVNLLDHISLTSTVQLRYDCQNNHPGDDVYINDVNVSAYG